MLNPGLIHLNCGSLGATPRVIVDALCGYIRALERDPVGNQWWPMRDRMDEEINRVYLKAAGEDDFVGVQTYGRWRYGPEGRLDPEPGVELTQVGYEFWPQALEATIRQAHSVAGVPIIVTENGISTHDDARRVAYYHRALQAVVECLNDGVDVRGYYAWSAFDNYEWQLGYEPHFGLIAVDRETQERTVKPSARFLGEIARANAF